MRHRQTQTARFETVYTMFYTTNPHINIVRSLNINAFTKQQPHTIHLQTGKDSNIRPFLKKMIPLLKTMSISERILTTQIYYDGVHIISRQGVKHCGSNGRRFIHKCLAHKKATTTHTKNTTLKRLHRNYYRNWNLRKIRSHLQQANIKRRREQHQDNNMKDSRRLTQKKTYKKTHGKTQQWLTHRLSLSTYEERDIIITVYILRTLSESEYPLRKKRKLFISICIVRQNILHNLNGI